LKYAGSDTSALRRAGRRAFIDSIESILASAPNVARLTFPASWTTRLPKVPFPTPLSPWSRDLRRGRRALGPAISRARWFGFTMDGSMPNSSHSAMVPSILMSLVSEGSKSQLDALAACPPLNLSQMSPSFFSLLLSACAPADCACAEGSLKNASMA
jgi:hypothetical protein